MLDMNFNSELPWPELKKKILAEEQEKIRQGEERAKRIREGEIRDARIWGVLWAIPFCLLFLAAALCH
jgi:hypothetical protein